jgi:hypothetical protein
MKDEVSGESVQISVYLLIQASSSSAIQRRQI